MNEEDLLRKLNYMYKHNQIVRLKKENKQKDEKIKEFSKEGKKIINEFGHKNKENIDKLNDKIRELQEENISLKQERNYYKEMFFKIPSFIRLLFSKRKKALTN